MDWESRVKAFLSNLTIRESEWKFVTSAGGTLSVSTPIARLGVSGTGGLLRVQRNSDRNFTQLNFGGLGGGVGVSLIPTPANFSFSIPQMPSAGRIYKLPFAGRSLSLAELRGAFVLFEIGADFGAGGSGALMFLGCNTMVSSLFGPMQLPAMLATANACVRFGGMTATLIPANAGINIHVGVLY